MTRTVDEEKRKEFYQIMLSDSERLLSTIEQVLRTGRIGPSNRILNFSSIDIGELVDECIDLTRKLRGLEPESLKYHAGPPMKVRGDLDEVRAAVMNLIDNAVKYSGNTVNVTVETAKIDNGHMVVRVKDQGVGISQGELKRIFKRFYRIPGPVSRRPSGTGLGLYIVRSVAKRHRGRAWAESEGPGRGSTFVLELPMSK
jgi:signal transduction histidine kinase